MAATATLGPWTRDRFDVAADPAMLARAIGDTSVNGGALAPGAHWDSQGNDAGTLAAMLEQLIGPIGLQPVDADAIACFEPFLRTIDHLRLCEPDLLGQARRLGWRKTDLGTIMDLNLLTMHLSRPATERLRICEVGGGFGRVAEAFLQRHDDRIHYVLVDAVPATLMYAYLYLRRAFPARRIGSTYAGDAYDASFDCFILPAWSTDALADATFDLAVNIESMQEMESRHVDHYLALFDRLGAADATIYVSNARDYVYRGSWEFPRTWEVLFQHNTPRSWSRDHPTFVMRKTSADQTAARARHEALFRSEMAGWNPGLCMLRPPTSVQPG